MFLQVASEYCGASEKRPDFMTYWSMLEKVDVKLPYRGPMERLNAARVNLKHKGLMPAKLEVEGFRVSVTAFFDESASAVLSTDFNRISLSTLVRSDVVRQLLELAEAALATGDFSTALGEAAKAFTISLREHTFRPRASHEFWRGYNLYEAFSPNTLVFGLNAGFHSEMRRFANAVGSAGEKLAEAVIVVGHNLDFEAYLLFKSHSPVVHQFIGGNVQVEWMAEPTTDPEIVRRCVNFAVDAAIRLEAAA